MANDEQKTLRVLAECGEFFPYDNDIIALLDTVEYLEAKLQLAEAAPDLLAALTALLESSIYADGEGSISIENGGCDDADHRAIVEQAKAAIAKAKPQH